MIRLLALGALAACSAGAPGRENDVERPEIAPARDGNIAIAEELCAAREAGTIASFDLFLARHPGHPLAAQARSEREQIRSGGRRAGKDEPPCPAGEGCR